eukprot:UN02297
MSGNGVRPVGTASPTTINTVVPMNGPSVSMTMTISSPTNPDLASLFECPVCFDYVLPPIYQCSSGHLVCSNCRPKLTLCPTCRGPLGSIRNLAMEKVANTVLFPCRFNSSGCGVTLPQRQPKRNMRSHASSNRTQR